MKKTFKVTVKDNAENITFSIEINSYGMRHAIEDSEKELKSLFPSHYHDFEIVGIEKI